MNFFSKILFSESWKVARFFSLVPIWCGVFVGALAVFAQTDVKIYYNMNPIYILCIYYLFFLYSVVTAFLFGWIPAFILGLVYTLMRLKKRWFDCAFVFLSSGIVAVSLTHFVSVMEYVDHAFYFYFFPDFLKNDIYSKAFVLGSAFSFIAAIIILPPKK